MKYTCKVKVKNRQGLHARPASQIVKLLQGIEAEVTFRKGEEVINAKSIVGILMLAASKNSVIEIMAEGKEAKRAIDLLEEGFREAFHED